MMRLRFRWRLRTLMIVVAIAAVALWARRILVHRMQVNTRNAQIYALRVLLYSNRERAVREYLAYLDREPLLFEGAESDRRAKRAASARLAEYYVERKQRFQDAVDCPWGPIPTEPPPPPEFSLRRAYLWGRP